jgi:NhaP-type Na+/H+ or K+/H+ antiporter
MLTELLNSVSAPSEGVGIILPIGLAVFFGTVGARIFQRLHIPQIIGYISVGIILGPVLNVISAGAVQALEPFNLLALGIIGFLIGGELKREVFVKFGRQVAAILLFEGGIAFLLVTLLSFLVLSYFHHWQIALGAGIVLGAICAATDPASTVNVLWEYKTRGPLTTMLTAIVALDDALALVLYIIGVSVAGFLTGHREGSPLQMALYALNEIVGSLALGVVAALVLRWIIARIRDDEKTLVFTVGTIVLTIGLAKYLHMDVILSAMALGVALMNLAPRRSLKSFELVRRFSPLVYVLFFVIIGARFNISSLSPFGLRAVLRHYRRPIQHFEFEPANLAAGCRVRYRQHRGQDHRLVLGRSLLQSRSHRPQVSWLLFIPAGHHRHCIADYGQSPLRRRNQRHNAVRHYHGCICPAACGPGVCQDGRQKRRRDGT